MQDKPYQQASTSPQPVMGGDRYQNITASTLIKTGEGYVTGVFVASSTAGTLKYWDQTSAAIPVLINTFTPNLGWNPTPFHFSTGLYITVGATIDCTVLYG